MANYHIICHNCGHQLDIDTVRCLCGADVHDATVRASRSALRLRFGRLLSTTVILLAAATAAAVFYTSGDLERVRTRVSEATGLTEKRTDQFISEAPLKAPPARPAARQIATPGRGVTPPPTAVAAGLALPPLTPVPPRR